MDTETDPLAITSADNMSLFEGSLENIEFVLEDDDSYIETKSNSIPIEIDNLEENNIDDIMKGKKVLNVSLEELNASIEKNQIIDLDALVTNSDEMKDEIQVKDVNTRLSCNDTNVLLPEVPICETLEDFNPGVMEPIYCYVLNCTSEALPSQNKEDTIHWFCVPTDVNLKKIWDICLNRIDRRLSQEDVVCHKHFSEEDIIYKISISSNDGEIIVPCSKPRLRQGAVPCMKFHKECCVPNCRRKTGKMFCFPVAHTIVFDLWLYLIKNPILKYLNLKEVLRHRVCIIHFDLDCLEDDFSLTRSAAPTLYVPDTFPVDLQPVNQEKIISSGKNNVDLICAHGECPNRSRTGHNLFKLPTEIDRCIAWLEACGLRSLISAPTETVRTMTRLKLGVCEDHFDFKDFVGTMGKLKVDAVPKPHYSELRKSKAFSAQGNKISSGFSKVTNILRKPVATHEKPGVLTNPDILKKPGVSGKPGVLGKPDVLENPGFTRNPGVLTNPNILEKPGISGKSDVLENPDVSKKSGVLSDPGVSGKPDVMEKSGVLNKLYVLDKPSVANLVKSLTQPSTGICCYRDCNSKKSPTIPFFSFPEDNERCLEWLWACGLTVSLCIWKKKWKCRQICSKHFKRDMFETNDKLKDNAVPITYDFCKQMKESVQQNEKTTATEHSYDSTSDDSNESNLYCAVENCPIFYNPKYHIECKQNFPNPNEDPQRFNIWLQLVSNPKLKELSQQEIYTKYMVCFKHFEAHFYQKNEKAGQLNQEAVPTKSLTADNQWFFTSDYYKSRLENYFTFINDDVQNVKTEWKEEYISDMHKIMDKTHCILEKDRIRFPGMGHSLYMEPRKNLSTRKMPYDVYTRCREGYGLNSYVEVGENMSIHTAIIIDDDDDCERKVLKQILSKRKKVKK